MPEKNPERESVPLMALIDAARQEDWAFVDGKIDNSDLTPERITWIMTEGIHSEEDNVRDLAATLLDRSNVPLRYADLEILEEQMLRDKYIITKYRIAIALYKRDYITEEVEDVMKKAVDDPNVGEEAKKYFK